MVRDAVHSRTAIPIRIVVNFVHDLSTGTWFASVLVISILVREMRRVPVDSAGAVEAAAHAMNSVFVLLVAALVGLILTGVLRLIYWRADTPPAQVQVKRTLLMWKHVAFVGLYGYGTAWAYLVSH